MSVCQPGPQDRIAYLLKRPVGRPAHHVCRCHASFSYQAGSWSKPRRSHALTPAALVACPAFAADQPPNMKGKWVGKTHTIVAGIALHWPSNKGTFEKPGLFEKDLVIEVTGQEDDSGATRPFPAAERKPRSP